jgi:hypothetical protein
VLVTVDYNILMNGFFIGWINSALFLLGILIVLLGLAMIIIPNKVHKFGERLNHWVSTDHFFNEIDKSRNSERFIYRHHRWAGGLIIIGAIYFIYIFLISRDIDLLMSYLPLIMNNKVLSEWIYQSLFYTLIFANFLCVIIGIFIFIRPSLLKGIEKNLNHWVDNEHVFKRLDKTHSIPEHVLPGNMRLFGFAVFLGGIYISLTVL